AVASGIPEIVLVISPGRVLAIDHLMSADELERHLEKRGKSEMLEAIRRTNITATITAVEQAEPLGLGHAVLQAREAIGDEPFGGFYPDDIVDAEKPLLRPVNDAAEPMDAPGPF